MRDFVALLSRLGQTTRTGAKVAALADYFRTAPAADRVWTIALFSGRRPKRTLSATALRVWAAERAGIPLWLFEDSYAAVGDLAETIALVLPPPAAAADRRGLADWIALVRGLPQLPEEARKAAILAAWDSLDGPSRLLFTKLITGGFRVGLSRALMTRALALATGQAPEALAHRLMGDWDPATTTWEGLIEGADDAADPGRPYPFCLAHPLPATGLPGDPAAWFAEWKWDGIRGQAIRRGRVFALWSRGEELLTDRFPDLAPLADHLPEGTVLDGEILAWDGDAPLPFARLQTRIGRRTLTRAALAAAPAAFMAYDLLEEGGADIRALPFAERRARLAALLAGLPAGLPLHLSPEVPFASTAELDRARDAAGARGAEGLMLKRRASPYGVGRRIGDWWKWKRDPFSIDAVMVYAQAGHGRRATLYTDFTFALRDGEALVPVAKAYSGLTDAEFGEITAWVRRNTLQRFGPVRQVPPELVFEIAFEGVQRSSRHKSGVALRFPRMVRWRRDKPATEIDTLDSLRALLPPAL
jgi:DNA ligase-1